MKAVASGLGGDIHLAGSAAKFGREDAGLHLELLNGVDGGQENIKVKADIGVVDPIQSEIIELAALAGDCDVLGGALASLPPGGGTVVAEAKAHIGAERNQLQEVASIQRQLHDALVFDHRSDRSVLGGQQRGPATHLDDFGDLSDV